MFDKVQGCVIAPDFSTYVSCQQCAYSKDIGNQYSLSQCDHNCPLQQLGGTCLFQHDPPLSSPDSESNDESVNPQPAIDFRTAVKGDCVHSTKTFCQNKKPITHLTQKKFSAILSV